MDSVFLFSYAISLKIIGTYGDRIHLKYFITLGMFFASLNLGLIAIIRIAGYKIFYLSVIFMMFNGIGQSTGWPGLIAVMSNWFGKENRGLLMGFWAGNCNVTKKFF